MGHRWQIVGKELDSNGKLLDKHTFGYWGSLRDIDADVMGGAEIGASCTASYSSTINAEWLTWSRFYKDAGVYVAYSSNGNEYQLWAEQVW